MKTLLLLLSLGFLSPKPYGLNTPNNAVLEICNNAPCALKSPKNAAGSNAIPCVLSRGPAHRIRLEIREKNMNDPDWTAGGRFHCPQSLRIDADLSRNVLGKNSAVIPPGDYPFTRMNGSYIIDFNTPLIRPPVMPKKKLPDEQSRAASVEPEALPVAVVIGSPRDNCSKYGICEVDALSQEAWNNFVSGHLRRAKALIHLENPHQIRFYFPLDGMLPCTRQHFFETGVFIVLSEKELPASFARKFGVANLRIVPGYYPVETLPGAGFNVRFSI